MSPTNTVPAAAFARDRVTWLGYLAIGLFAFLQSSLGPLMPFLQEDLGFGYSLASIHFSAMALGLVVAGLGGERLVRGWGRAVAFWRGLTGLAIAAILLIASPIAAGTSLGAFGIGAWGALLSIAIQAHLAEQHGSRRAQAITELNLASSTCAVLASVAVGAAAQTEIGWRGALLIAVAAYVLIALGFRRVNINAAVLPGAGYRAAGRPLPGTFWSYALVIFLGVSIDWSIAFWGADFLAHSSGLSRANAATAMSAFFIAIVVGRFAGSRLASRLETTRLLRGTLLITGGGFLLFWLGPAPLLAGVGLFVTGLGTANVYPFAYAAALDAAPDRADVATTRLALCGGVAILTVPVALGFVAEGVGIDLAYGIVLPLLAVALAAVLLTGRRGLAGEQAPREPSGS